MKKLFCVTLSVFLLSSCFGWDENTVPSGLVVKQWEGYSMMLPKNWEDLSESEQIVPAPSEGKIELVAKSKENKAGFSNNLIILSDELQKPSTSQDYSLLNNVGTQKESLDYVWLGSEKLVFNDGTESKVYVFEAKYNLQTQKYKYIQTAKVCDQRKGYLLTIGILPSNKEVDKYKDLLKTFSCAPNNEEL